MNEKIIKFKVSDKEHKENLVTALAVNGYPVWVKEISHPSYYIYVRVPAEAVSDKWPATSD